MINLHTSAYYDVHKMLNSVCHRIICKVITVKLKITLVNNRHDTSNYRKLLLLTFLVTNIFFVSWKLEA